MTARYYKTVAGSEANAAYVTVQQQTKDMIAAAKRFAALFDGTPVFATDFHGRNFKGIKLNNFEERPDKHLWTKPIKQWGFISSPRGKALIAADKTELEALNNRYMQHTPAIREVSFDPLFQELGTDWGNLLFCGISFFDHEGILYISTKAELKNCTEILASEYAAADKARQAGGVA
jgi:hypothetical protein